VPTEEQFSGGNEPKGEKEEWEEMYIKFHDQSSLSSSPGYYWHAGLKYLA